MGWLELLPLLRRLLPMLSQVTPLLESLLAVRLGSRAEAEKTTTAMAQVTSAHAEVTALLQQQENRLTLLAEELKDLRSHVSTLQDRATSQERQLTALATSLRVGVGIVGGLLLVCILLLGVLVLRHS